MMGPQARGWSFVTERIYGGFPGVGDLPRRSRPARNHIVTRCVDHDRPGQSKLITAVGWEFDHQPPPCGPTPTCGNQVRASSFINESSFPDSSADRDPGVSSRISV